MILIDVSHMFFRQFFMNLGNILEFEQDPDDPSKKVCTGEVNEGFLTHLIYNNVLSFSNKFGGSKQNRVVACCDSKPSWRHHWYVENCKNFLEYKGETYKGDRTKSDDYPWPKIWDALNDGLDALEQLSDFTVLRVDLAEADDLIAVLAKEYRKTEDVYVCSSDKDFRQLQSETCHIFDPIKKLIVPPIDVERYKKIHFLVAGDDNIKQVKKGVGEKTAEKMLKELDIILQTNADIRERYEFNRTLIDFDYIPTDLSDEILRVFGETSASGHNPTGLLSFFSKKAMRKLAQRIPEFKLPIEGKKFSVPRRQEQSEKVDTSIEDFFNS